MFILPAGRHVMLLQCANMYAGNGRSNTKYNMKYNTLLFWPWQFERHTLQICKSKP